MIKIGLRRLQALEVDMYAGKLNLAVARREIKIVGRQFAPQFVEVVRALNMHPELRPAMRGRSRRLVGEGEYLRHLAARFAKAREPRLPEPPTTVPDLLVGHVLKSYFQIADSELKRISETHQLSMAAENIVGDLLERYIASVLEPRGWVWCAGSVLKKVDFLRPAASSQTAVLLQVKNRDNSENSASSAIRDGTCIEKWFRAFSRQPKTNWERFPGNGGERLLSEKCFVRFVRTHLVRLRQSEL